MKTLLVVMALGTCAQAAPVTAPVAAPVVAEAVAEQNGLRVSVNSYRKGSSEDKRISLGTNNPGFAVFLQNMTSEPISIPDEWNSWGNYCLTLEISKVNDRVLEKPLVVRRTEGTWFRNGSFVEIIDANEVVAHSVPLFLPAEAIKNSIVPVSQNGKRLNSSYYGFPFPNSSAPIPITMRAVYSNDFPGRDAKRPAWTGRIASPWKDYLVSW